MAEGSKTDQFHWAYEADGDALQKWRKLTPAQRAESDFLVQRAIIRRLDEMNGRGRANTEWIEEHKAEHKTEMDILNFMKLWGARGTGLIMLSIAIATFIIFVQHGGYHP